MVDVDEDDVTAQIWQHFPWTDASHQLEHHCVINQALTPGFSVKWEWRYFHDKLKIQTDPWRYLPRGASQYRRLRFIHSLMVPLDNLFKDNDKVSKERTIPTLALLAMLSYHTGQRQNSEESRQLGMMELLSLVAASFQGYHLVHTEQLLFSVDLSGPLPCQISMGHIMISGSQELINMQPFINRYHGFETAWRSVVKKPWHNHTISSTLSKPLLADVIVVLLKTASKTQALDDPASWWMTFGHKLMASIIYIVAVMLEAHLRCKAIDFAKASIDMVQQPLRRLSTPAGNKRRVDVANKVFWLKFFKKAKNKVNETMLLLTDNILPSSTQKGAIPAMFGLYMRTLKDRFSGVNRVQLVWDSSMHTEDTMVFIVWSTQNQSAGYSALQALQKQIQPDIEGNNELLHLQMIGKLKKQSSLIYLKSVEGTLQSMGKCLDDFKCPEGLWLQPLAANQLRIKQGGNYYIMDTDTGVLVPQVPDGFCWSSVPVLSHMIDQGSIGVAAVHHMMVSMHTMSIALYDYYHRVWNDIKNAARSSKGFFYAILLKYSLVFNLNYGPFGKGGWFSDKQAWLSDMATQLKDCYQMDPWFKERAPGIAKDNGWPEPCTAEDYTRIWNFLFTMKGFRIKGPLSKIMRWFSFFECRAHYRNELNGLKLVLEHHFKTVTDDDDTADLILPVANSDPKEELLAMKKTMGGLKLACKIITDDSLWSLDCIFYVCEKIWSHTSKRSKYYRVGDADRANAVLTPADFKRQLIADSKGAWMLPLQETVHNCMYNHRTFQSLGLFSDSTPTSTRVEDMVDFMLLLISNRAMSMVTREVEPPFRYAQLHSTVPTEVANTLDVVRKDWAQLLEAEQAYAIAPDDCTAVPAMLWRLCLPIRALMLALDICNYDLNSDVGMEALKLMDALLDILGDSKCIEDTHAHLRYLAAKAKNSISGRASRFHSCIHSKVLEGRGVNTPSLDDCTIALSQWTNSLSSRKLIEKQTQTSSVKATSDMLDIMKDEHTSPSPQSMFISVAATKWILDVWPAMAPDGCSMNAPWQSILVGQHSVLRYNQQNSDAVLSLVHSVWGVLCWKLHYIGPDATDPAMATWILSVHGPVACWKHVVDPDEWDIVPHKACAPERLGQSGCIPLVQTAEPKSVLAHGLQSGVSMTKTQLLLLCQMRGITIPNNASKATIVLHLVKSVFADKSDQDAALAKLNQPNCDVQVGEKIDPVLDELIEETAADDANMDEQIFLKQAKKAKRNYTRKQNIKQSIQQSKLDAKSAAKSRAQSRKAHARHKPKPKAAAKVRARGKAKAKSGRAKARATSSSSAKAATQIPDAVTEADIEDLFSEPSFPGSNAASYTPRDCDTVPGSEAAAPHHGGADGEDDDDDDAEVQVVVAQISQEIDPVAAGQDLFGDMDWNLPAEPVQEPPSSAAQKPRQSVHGVQRLHYSPACLSQLCGPHGIIRLDSNAHRFIAECSIGYPNILQDRRPHQQKTSGQIFAVATSWQQSLIYAHTWLWTKYTLLPDDMRPSMPPGTLPQTPGVIPQSVMDDLAANTIPYMPEAPKKY